LWKYIPQADQVTVSAGYYDEAFIANANGNVVGKTKLDGDDLVVSTVQLSKTMPKPNKAQPVFGLPAQAYLLDNYSNMLLKPYYDRHWKERA
jgi:hypothetical protein